MTASNSKSKTVGTKKKFNYCVSCEFKKMAQFFLALRLTVATTFRFYIHFFCLSSIFCLLCIMSNFFHFLFHPAPFFHVLFFIFFECKQVRAVWILYNPSDLLCNIICTRWISFCRVRCFAYIFFSISVFSVCIFFFYAVLYISVESWTKSWILDEPKRKRNKKLENVNEQKCLEKGKCCTQIDIE